MTKKSTRPACGRIHVLGRRFAPDLPWVLAVLVLAVGPSVIAAQVRPEFRAELVSAGHERVELGGGLTAAIGSYLRANATATRDVWSSSVVGADQWRGESTIRFLLDPLAQQRYGLSFGVGLGYRERPYLVVLMDIEGPRTAGIRPALSLSLGGGMRAALVLRTRGTRDRR